MYFSLSISNLVFTKWHNIIASIANLNYFPALENNVFKNYLSVSNKIDPSSENTF